MIMNQHQVFFVKNIKTNLIQMFAGTPQQWNLSTNYITSSEEEYSTQTKGRYRKSSTYNRFL